MPIAELTRLARGDRDPLTSPARLVDVEPSAPAFSSVPVYSTVRESTEKTGLIINAPQPGRGRPTKQTMFVEVRVQQIETTTFIHAQMADQSVGLAPGSRGDPDQSNHTSRPCGTANPVREKFMISLRAHPAVTMARDGPSVCAEEQTLEWLFGSIKCILFNGCSFCSFKYYCIICASSSLLQVCVTRRLSMY